MSAWLGALLLVAGFVILCRAFGLIPGTRRVLTVARQSFAVIGDASLPDETKEKVLQAHALRLFRLFGLLFAGGLGAAALPLAGLWGADRYGVFSWDDVVATTLSWPFLSLSVLAGLVVLGWRRGRGGATAKGLAFENRYSAPERWLHEVAFASVPAQIALAGVEDRLHRDALSRISVERPVFITALPRAGTTLLLELCAGLDEFAAHTYRRMPFVLTPLLWERFSRSFRVDTQPRERAHGDGLVVTVDSPEALEEVLWLGFWAEHYEGNWIRPWEPDEAHPEFLEFFRSHIRKLILATRGDRRGGPVRYVSKNNANIARIRWLAEAFPDARFVVPFREPLQHAASLRRQHRNFLELHRTDDFARRYMAAIGHFDFGANLRPIDFAGGRGSVAPIGAADRLDFWLTYWTAAYKHVVDAAGSAAGARLLFVEFDALCAEPDAGLAGVADFLEIRNRTGFSSQSQRIHRPKPHAVSGETIAPDLLTEARNLHATLVALAAAPPARAPSTPTRHGDGRTTESTARIFSPNK